MNESISHNEASIDRKVQEMTFCAGNMPNLYAAYLELRKENAALRAKLQEHYIPLYSEKEST